MALLDITALKAKIDNWITANGNKEITGPQMNEILKDLIDSAPNFISNAGSIGLADYVATEIYNENGEGQVVVFDDQIYQAKDGELNITGAFDPLKWDLIADISPNIIDSVNGETGTVVLNTDNIDDSFSLNKYVTTAEKASIASASQPGDNISDFINDAGYITSALQSGDNISELINDAGYLTSIPGTYIESGDNISELVNDAGYLTSGDNISELINDSGYITSFENIANSTLTFSSNRTHDLNSNNLRFNNGIININVSSTYRMNLSANATGGGIFIGGVSTGAGLNAVGNFGLAAGYFSNSSGEALRTVTGNVRLVSSSGNVGIGGFFDGNYKLNVEAGSSNGAISIRGTANAIAAINIGLTGLSTNIAAQYSCVNGTNNVAVLTVNGDNKLNSSSGSTAIGKSLGSTIEPSAILELESTTQGFKLMEMTSAEASAITPVNALMLYVTDTNGTFTSIGFWGYENGTWNKL